MAMAIRSSTPMNTCRHGRRVIQHAYAAAQHDMYACCITCYVHVGHVRKAFQRVAAECGQRSESGRTDMETPMHRCCGVCRHVHVHAHAYMTYMNMNLT
eukprot:1184467-Prymnesium_polylepis.1